MVLKILDAVSEHHLDTARLLVSHLLRLVAESLCCSPLRSHFLNEDLCITRVHQPSNSSSFSGNLILDRCPKIWLFMSYVSHNFSPSHRWAVENQEVAHLCHQMDSPPRMEKILVEVGCARAPEIFIPPPRSISGPVKCFLHFFLVSRSCSWSST